MLCEGIYFFTYNDVFMTVYLIKEKEELQVHQVQPDREVTFLAEKGDKILLWGDSIVDVLRKFEELPIVISP
jgi:hypothetical protein